MMMIRICPRFFFLCFLFLAGCTYPSFLSLQHSASLVTRHSSSVPRQDASFHSAISQPSRQNLAKHSLMFLLTGSGNRFTVLGSALSVDSLGHLLTTAAVVTDAATGQPFTRVFIAERNLDSTSFFTCTAVGVVAQYMPQKHSAVIRPIAPVQPDCTEQSNLLEEWNKFSFFALRREKDLEDGMRVQLLGFSPSPSYERVFSPGIIHLSRVSDTGSVILSPDTHVRYAFSPLFVFDVHDALVGMLEFRHALDLSSSFFIPTSGIADVHR